MNRVVLINLKEFQSWLMRLSEGKLENAIDKYLNEECQSMAEEMRKQLGTYQPGKAGFSAWPALKPETIAKKKRGDSPLLEDGDMEASCQYLDLGPMKKLVGCTDGKAGWHEFGVPSKNVPARPFVRPVVWMRIDSLKKGIRKALVAELRASRKGL